MEIAYHCPCCGLPMTTPGQLVSGEDGFGAYFVFAYCLRCAIRLRGLPESAGRRQRKTMIGTIAKRGPERHAIRFLADATEAKLFLALGSERGDLAVFRDSGS